jgi:hypothetical protein
LEVDFAMVDHITVNYFLTYVEMTKNVMVLCQKMRVLSNLSIFSGSKTPSKSATKTNPRSKPTTTQSK